VSLALGKAAGHDVLDLAGQLLLDVLLEASQEEGAQHSVQSGDQSILLLLLLPIATAVDDVVHGVGEPFLCNQTAAAAAAAAAARRAATTHTRHA
jgi:hypothetical protein